MEVQSQVVKVMPEYRQDPLTGRMVIVAEARAARPHQFDITDQLDQTICPFCDGNELETPNETAAFRSADSSPNSSGWRVRVVPNRYPAVIAGEVPHVLSDGTFISTGGKTDGIGLHEVIIDTSRHVLSIADLSPSEIADMLAMYQLRLRTLRTDSRWAYVQIFKNVGAAAGASLPHSHSQLTAIPFLPPSFSQMLHRAADHFHLRGRCLWCERLEQEIQIGERIVEKTEHFTVLCPFVSRFAGEIEIYPINHESAFDRMEASLLSELSDLFRRTIIRLGKVVSGQKDSLAYNVILNTEPFLFQQNGKRSDCSSLFHWHFSILPSLARAAGFEWGTGLHINPISPEQAAKRLRHAK